MRVVSGWEGRVCSISHALACCMPFDALMHARQRCAVKHLLLAYHPTGALPRARGASETSTGFANIVWFLESSFEPCMTSAAHSATQTRRSKPSALFLRSKLQLSVMTGRKSRSGGARRRCAPQGPERRSEVLGAESFGGAQSIGSRMPSRHDSALCRLVIVPPQPTCCSDRTSPSAQQMPV